MANKYESAVILLKLYELRREEVLRKARDWFAGFQPNSTEEVIDTIRGKHGAYYRMVMSYWEMATSFVNHDVIDEEMFNDSTLEHVAVFSKVHPFITELRSIVGEPEYYKHLEKLVMRIPNAEGRLAQFRKRMKVIAAANEAANEEQTI